MEEWEPGRCSERGGRCGRGGVGELRVVGMGMVYGDGGWSGRMEVDEGYVNGDLRCG